MNRGSSIGESNLYYVIRRNDERVMPFAFGIERRENRLIFSPLESLAPRLRIIEWEESGEGSKGSNHNGDTALCEEVRKKMLKAFAQNELNFAFISSSSSYSFVFSLIGLCAKKRLWLCLIMTPTSIRLDSFMR